MSADINNPMGPLAEPELSTVLQQLKDDIFASFNCHQLGVIDKFDPATQTATVKIKVLRQVPDISVNPPKYNAAEYPLLVECPVFILQGGNGAGYVTFPILPGDPCLVLFNDRSIDNWYATGNTAVPDTGRMHDLSDGLILVGFRNLSNPLAGYDMANGIIAYKGGKLKLADKVALLGKDSDLKTVLNTVVAALTALNGKTGPSAAVQITAVTTEITKFLQ